MEQRRLVIIGMPIRAEVAKDTGRIHSSQPLTAIKHKIIKKNIWVEMEKEFHQEQWMDWETGTLNTRYIVGTSRYFMNGKELKRDHLNYVVVPEELRTWDL